MSEIYNNLQRYRFTIRNMSNDEQSVIRKLAQTILGQIDTEKRIKKPTIKFVDDVPTQDSMFKLVNKYINNNKDTIRIYQENDREDYTHYIIENEYLESLLPKMLSESELKAILVSEGVTNIGQAMKFLNQNYKNQFNGKVAQGVINSVLNQK